jgi:hypothetical protein
MDRPVSDGALRGVMLGWLRRVARSPHRERLVLRGSVLTSAWCPGRRAADVDHLVLGGFVHDQARALVDELLAAPDAAVTFDAATTEHAVIWAETPSPGLRTKVIGRDASGTTTLLQIDLGQGDELVHAPVPVSIDGGPEVLGVTPETMFGWKTDGLFEFGHGSWRAKDLYDLWLIDRHVALAEEAVILAVRAAFAHQGTELSAADRFLFDTSWGASRGSRRSGRASVAARASRRRAADCRAFSRPSPRSALASCRSSPRSATSARRDRAPRSRLSSTRRGPARPTDTTTYLTVR